MILNQLKNEINDFKAGLQFTKNKFKQKVESLEKKHENIYVKVDEVYEFVHNKLMTLKID